MATTMVQRRNIVVLGKTGAGKSTVANKIAGHDNFKVKSSTESVTSKVSHTEVVLVDPKTNTQYNFKLIDTIGVFDTKKRNADIMKEIKKYFQEKVPEGVNLVLFIFRKGRYTGEEKQTFDYIIKNFRPQISDISALIITNCENEGKEGRQRIIDEFRLMAEDTAEFMGKGIYTVGFPDTRNCLPALEEAYEKVIQDDAKDLRELVMKAGEMRLGKEMFEMGFWEKLTQCVLL